MKKIFLFFFFILPIIVCGCSKPAVQQHNPDDYKRTYNISDEYYLKIITDIVNNPSDYIGNNINIEGIYKKEDGKTFVYRNGPECCYPEGVICGFEFEDNTDFLSENDWIKVSGTLSYYQTDESYNLVLKNCKIEQSDVRGLETVSHDHIQTELYE